MTNNTLTLFAQQTKNPLAQQLLANLDMPYINTALALNSSLEKSLWLSFYKKADVAIAVNLVFHKLDKQQILLAATDKRRLVRVALFYNGLPSCDMQTALTLIGMQTFDRSIAERCWDQYQTPDGIQKQLFAKTLGSYSGQDYKDVKSNNRAAKVIGKELARFLQQQYVDLPNQYATQPELIGGRTIAQLSNGFTGNRVAAIHQLDELLAYLNKQHLSIVLAMYPTWELTIDELIQTANSMVEQN